MQEQYGHRYRSSCCGFSHFHLKREHAVDRLWNEYAPNDITRTFERQTSEYGQFITWLMFMFSYLAHFPPASVFRQHTVALRRWRNTHLRYVIYVNKNTPHTRQVVCCVPRRVRDSYVYRFVSSRSFINLFVLCYSNVLFFCFHFGNLESNGDASHNGTNIHLLSVLHGAKIRCERTFSICRIFFMRCVFNSIKEKFQFIFSRINTQEFIWMRRWWWFNAIRLSVWGIYFDTFDGRTQNTHKYTQTWYKRLPKQNLPCETRPSTTVVIICPFFVILVVLVRSAERERLVRVLDGDAERCDERDDGRGIEFRPSFILNFTLNIFFLLFTLSLLRCTSNCLHLCLLHSM